jgi:tRNA nucleotidyltransferase (CCA-adding enzyme)
MSRDARGVSTWQASAAGGQGALVIERLPDTPGGRELLALADAHGDVALVGGSVRDLLRPPCTPRELDVVVDGEAAQLAQELATRLPGNEARMPETTVHERFGTAAVDWIYGRIDIAERRAETYARPGALPEVRPGTVGEDLARRDFTVNAISVSLGGPEQGKIIAAERALEDLAAGRLRILHERSFIDDPTRLLRLARYSARLGFEAEEQTAQLAHEAIAAGALDTVSGARIGAELWLVTEEPTTDAFTVMGELGELDALSLPASFDASLLHEAGVLLPADGIWDILQMGVLFHPARPASAVERRAAARLMERFEFFAETREKVLACAFDCFALADDIEAAQRPSELHRALAAQPIEAVAMAGALGARRDAAIAERVRRWIADLRGVELLIGGADLLAAGVPEGPQIGRRLRRALERKLDGELAAGRDAELRAALEADA